MIEIKQLVKRFGYSTAVNNVTFSVGSGEVLGFLGPNGAGKSTTMKMITGFLTPDAGSISVCGLDITNDPVDVKRMIGYLPEGAPCYGDMTVQQFLRFIAEVRGFKRGEKTARIDHVVSQLQLVSVLHQTIDTLSKGFKRRVGLAQAIMHDPKVLVLDEPTDGLDPNQKQQVRELIRNLSKDKIVIISTHILEEVMAVCSRAIIIHHGEIVADATPAALQTRSRYFKSVTLQLQSEYPVADVLSTIAAIDGVEQDDSQPNTYTIFPKEGQDIFVAVNEIAHEQQWPVQALYVDPGRLDDVFCKVTGGQA